MYATTGIEFAIAFGFMIFGCIILYAQGEICEFYMVRNKWTIRCIGIFCLMICLALIALVLNAPSRAEREKIIRSAFDIPPDKVKSVIITLARTERWGNIDYEEYALTNTSQIAFFCAALADRKEVMIDHPSTDWQCSIQVNSASTTNSFRVHVLSTGGALINLESNNWQNYGDFMSVKLHKLLTQIVFQEQANTEDEKE